MNPGEVCVKAIRDFPEHGIRAGDSVVFRNGRATQIRTLPSHVAAAILGELQAPSLVPNSAQALGGARDEAAADAMRAVLSPLGSGRGGVA